MPGVTRYLVTLGLLCLQTGSGAVTVTILEPIRSIGDEVGLIFVPEAHLSGDQYNTTGNLSYYKTVYKSKLVKKFKLSILL